VRRGIDKAPMEVDENGPLASLIKKHTQVVLGRTPAVVGMTGWTDAATLSEAGIPSVLFGPSGTGAHAVTEWVDLRSVQQCAEIYLNVAREFCE
jgi:acetylornithine deacetylase